jgi:cell wall-associated NlpC family hydrolase
LIAVVAIAATLTVATPAQAAQTKTVTITIHSGDTLTGIAARHCGTAKAYTALATGNGISNPSRIYAGHRLRLTCARPTAAPAAKKPATKPVATSRIRTVVNYALAQVGDPYRWGAAGPNAFDCSGLVVASYARIGIKLPHQTGALISRGVRVSRANLRLGDLVFLSRSHVGIYIGNNMVVVAPQSGQRVKKQIIYAFLTARRIIK